MRAALLPVLFCLSLDPVLAAVVEKPAALVADGVPEVPVALAERTRPYMEFRTASFLGWQPQIGRSWSPPASATRTRCTGWRSPAARASNSRSSMTASARHSLRP
jgi:hypothetical protein